MAASATMTATNPNEKSHMDISKTQAQKELKVLFTDNDLDTNKLVKKVTGVGMRNPIHLLALYV